MYHFTPVLNFFTGNSIEMNSDAFFAYFPNMKPSRNSDVNIFNNHLLKPKSNYQITTALKFDTTKT